MGPLILNTITDTQYMESLLTAITFLSDGKELFKTGRQQMMDALCDYRESLSCAGVRHHPKIETSDNREVIFAFDGLEIGPPMSSLAWQTAFVTANAEEVEAFRLRLQSQPALLRSGTNLMACAAALLWLIRRVPGELYTIELTDLLVTGIAAGASPWQVARVVAAAALGEPQPDTTGPGDAPAGETYSCEEASMENGWAFIAGLYSYRPNGTRYWKRVVASRHERGLNGQGTALVQWSRTTEGSWERESSYVGDLPGLAPVEPPLSDSALRPPRPYDRFQISAEDIEGARKIAQYLWRGEGMEMLDLENLAEFGRWDLIQPDRSPSDWDVKQVDLQPGTEFESYNPSKDEGHHGALAAAKRANPTEPSPPKQEEPTAYEDLPLEEQMNPKGWDLLP